MTRRAFIRNLSLACAALGVPVALASRPHYIVGFDPAFAPDQSTIVFMQYLEAHYSVLLPPSFKPLG